MKCPKCGANISELDEICPKCNTKLDEYEEEQERQEEKNEDKTIFLRIINAIQIIACIILAIISFADEEIGNGIVMLIVGFVIFAFIKGFKDMIELLDSINNKLK